MLEKIQPKKLFNERYCLMIDLGYGGHIINVDLFEIQNRPFTASSFNPSYSYLGYVLHKQVNIKSIESEYKLSSEQKELLKILENHYQKADPVHLLCLAKTVGLKIKIRNDHGHERLLNWETINTKVWTIKISEEQKKSFYGAYLYKVIRLNFYNFSPTLSQVFCQVFSGKDGLIIISGNNVQLYAMNFLLAKIIERAITESNERQYYRIPSPALPNGKGATRIYTDLLEDEYENINQILKACKEFCILSDNSIKLNDYKIIQHEPSVVITVDYQILNKPALITVLLNVDYGGLLLAVGDMYYFSYAQNNYGINRRWDPIFGVLKIIHLENKIIHLTQIDKKIEKELFKLIRIKGKVLGIGAKGKGTFRGLKQINQFTSVYLSEIKKLGYPINYLHDIPQETIQAEFKADFDIDFNVDNDWLAFDLALYCGKERVQLADIELCLKNKDSQITTKDGRNIKITNPLVLKRLIELLSHFRKNKDGIYEGKTYHAPELEAMALGSPYYSAKVSQAFSAFIEEAKQGKLIQPLKIPEIFNLALRDYQKEGILWLNFLHKYRFAGILADDMGLGKTLQALVIMSIYPIKGKPSLIIVPKTLLHNWENEILKFTPHLKTIIIEGNTKERKARIKLAKEYDLVLTSYPALQRDLESYEENELTFNYCVLDEAQYVKNPHTKSSHTVRRVKSEYRLVLTGTPLENGVQELWSQFDFLMPGFFGSHNNFQKQIGNPIMKYSNTEALSNLRVKLKCFMLRRTKEEVLQELPKKIEQAITCELSDEQNLLYQEVLRQVKKNITDQVNKEGFAKSQIHILAGLTKLRQICNHPALVLSAKKQEDYPSAKLEACLEIIEEIYVEKRKVLVFSQFTKMLDILAKELNKQKIPYTYMTGQTKNRKEVIHSFTNDKNIPVFLISTKTGGVGLNLTVADTVVIFDPWWNPQVEHQAIDRTHRIGQTKSVNVYRLRTKGTIEEKIIALQERKQKLFDALVSDSKDMFKKLTWEDVKGLLMS